MLFSSMCKTSSNGSKALQAPFAAEGKASQVLKEGCGAQGATGMRRACEMNSLGMRLPSHSTKLPLLGIG